MVRLVITLFIGLMLCQPMAHATGDFEDIFRGGLWGCAAGNLVDDCSSGIIAGIALGYLLGSESGDPAVKKRIFKVKTDGEIIFHRPWGTTKDVEPAMTSKGQASALIPFFKRTGRTVVVIGYRNSETAPFDSETGLTTSLSRAMRMAYHIDQRSEGTVKVKAVDGGVVEGHGRHYKVILQ